MLNERQFGLHEVSINPHKMDAEEMRWHGIRDPGSANFTKKRVKLEHIDGWPEGFMKAHDYQDSEEAESFAANVAETRRSARTMPPIVTVERGGRHTVIDGHHRVAIMAHLGRKSISAFVHSPSESFS